jgi:penicillin-binding protein 1C
VGRQCQRRADARCQRHQRRGAGLAALVQHLHRIEASRPERFLAGTEQVAWRPGTQVSGGGVPARAFGIRQPRDGSLFAIDPDIPPAAQRIRFVGERGTWVLDGRRLGTDTEWSWAPWPGRHELRLVARDGRVLQQVRFEVRGAGLRATAAAPGAPLRRTTTN